MTLASARSATEEEAAAAKRCLPFAAAGRPSGLDSESPQKIFRVAALQGSLRHRRRRNTVNPLHLLQDGGSDGQAARVKHLLHDGPQHFNPALGDAPGDALGAAFRPFFAQEQVVLRPCAFGLAHGPADAAHAATVCADRTGSFSAV